VREQLTRDSITAFMAKSALGKGLGALINTRVAQPTPDRASGESVELLPLKAISPSPLQPRTEFPQGHLSELVDSIREKGIIQPLIVRKISSGSYELIAGERRWRAATELKLSEAPAIVRKATDLEVLELALIENLQREGLNPVEEALAYQRLHREFDQTQDQIARQVGKSRAAVANAMRLLGLPDEIQGLLKHNKLSVGHAKVLLSLKSQDEQLELAREIIKLGASVRAAERMAQTGQAERSESSRQKTGAASQLEPAIQRVQNLLMHRLSTRVVIDHKEKKGRIMIEYYGSDDLSRLLDSLGIKEDA